MKTATYSHLCQLAGGQSLYVPSGSQMALFTGIWNLVVVAGQLLIGGDTIIRKLVVMEGGQAQSIGR